MGNLPVYYKVSNGGTNERTVLRKYGGDVNKLIAALQTVVDDAAIALGKHPRHLPVPIRLYHGRLEVKGRPHHLRLAHGPRLLAAAPRGRCTACRWWSVLGDFY